MIKHTLLLAMRNFMRHKSSFFINLVGLSTGLAGAILIFLWVNDELKVDKIFDNDDRLFHVMEHQQYEDGILTVRSTPGLLAETLAEEIPEIEHAATIMWGGAYTLSVDDKDIKKVGPFVGSDFFEILSFNLLKGEADQVLSDINSMVISESVADNFFNSVDEALGKTIIVDHDKVYTISGVFEDIPQHSTLQADFLLSYEGYKKENDWVLNWRSNGPRTIARLKEGANADFVSTKIADFVKQRVENSHVTLFLKPYSERYLYGRYENGVLVGGRVDYVYLFSVIAIFILVIACINFMNLSTARASRRAKEIGVKKAIGAERKSLIGQYLLESILITSMSLVLSLVIVLIALPQFNLLTDKEIVLQLSPVFLMSLLGLTVLTGLLAGSYPALYLSSFKPVRVLKGEIKTSLGELWARRGLVVFQFTLSIILIVSVFVVYRQIQFINNKNLGYEKDNLIYFNIDGRLEEQKDAFLAGAKNLPGITNISTIAHDLVGQQNNTMGIRWDGKDPESRILFEHIRINYDLLETIGVNLADGRFFSRQYGADTAKIIFNESAIKIMGMEDPVGKRITYGTDTEMEIIGVIEDFHFQSMHEEMNPLFFRLVPEQTWYVMAKLQKGQEQEGISQLGAFYEKFNPGFTFDFKFVDQQYALQYAAEQRVASLSRYFAGIAILISCLGLLGLAAFTADRKKKEIGIRKVLGASIANIFILLTRDFTRLVIIALVIGLPISYFIANNWLNRFAFRTELNFGVFLIASALVLFISWLTVSTQAIRSASTDPIGCLRDE
ncbi:MAG: ABC transporter permease [Bacteroidota bacterium]